MKSANSLLKAGCITALLTVILALAPTRLSAQCCDLVVDVDEDVNCCIQLLTIFWADTPYPLDNKYYCPGEGEIFPRECPATLVSVEIKANYGWGSITIPVGTYRKLVQIREGCCVFITLDQSWPAAPCYYLHIEKAKCPG